MAQARAQRVLPGFGLSLGFTLAYLSLIVLIPLAAVFIRSASLSFPAFWEVVTSPRVLASYRLSFGASLLAAAINVAFGFMLAWSLVRYSFPGKRIVDALVDLPFALPTAVAGIALTALYARNGWLGQYLESFGSRLASALTNFASALTDNVWLAPYLGWLAPFLDWLARHVEPLSIKVAFTPLGVLVALIFIGLPFVVRTVQPVLEDLDTELEEAAASLGAGRWQTMRRVVLPTLVPALLTGFALAFARAVGEYGSVIFIAGNLPMVSEITPLIIITKLEQYDYVGATAVAAVMLVVSFLLLLIINGLQSWTDRRSAKVR
jgi:sulfate transport system permease protein